MSYIDLKYLNLVAFHLRNFKAKRDGTFNFSCPFCGDSSKNPRRARGYVFKHMGKYLYKCHNCNHTCHVSEVISHVDPGVYGEYKLETYIENQEVTAKKPIRTVKFDKVPLRVYSNMERCDKLLISHPATQYLRVRKIPHECYDRLYYTNDFAKLADELFPNHGMVVDNSSRLVMPFFGDYNEILAVSGRAFDNNSIRYMTVRGNDSGPLVFGLDKVNLNKPIKVVEGPLDSLFLDNCLASGDANLLSTLKVINGNHTFIFDNEPRNREIVENMKKVINSGRKIVIWPDTFARRGKDINLMVLSGLSREFIEKTIEENTFTGLIATMKLNHWSRI